MCMTARRLLLQSLLEEVLGSDKVYFQPPPNKSMAYPCIVYQRDDANTEFAGNRPYSFKQRYQVTLIAPDPDSDILGKLAALPLSRYDRFYTTNSKNHDVFVLYY